MHHSGGSSGGTRISRRSRGRRRHRGRSYSGGGYGGGGYGGVWLGTRTSSCIDSRPCGLFKAPIERSTLLLDLALGGGAVVGAPRASGAQGAVLFRLRAGYRTPPFTYGSGLALELALNTGFHGGFSSEARGSVATDDEGLLLAHLGGDMRLFFRARERLQPYLQVGVAYVVLNSGEEEPALTGAGMIVGGGLLYWLHPHFALDLGLRYDGARLEPSHTVQAFGLGLGFKLYL